MPSTEKKYSSASGIEIKKFYTPDDILLFEYNKSAGFPGEVPFTRGIQSTMYRGKLWTMRQYAGYGTAEETNKRFKYLMGIGQHGLSVAFDLPTQMGLDSDHPLARGEVGRVGVAIDTLADMESVFDGIPLELISTSMTANAQAFVMLAMYVAVAEKRGVSLKRLRGTVQNDILKEYVARGTYIFNPSYSMRLATDLIEYCAKELPQWNPISISGYHVREAGCSALQETAFMLANGIAYIDEVLKRGIDIDEFVPRLSWIMASGMDLFEETAKFRAVRRMWAEIARERFGARNHDSMKFRVFTATMGSTLTRQEPLNNVVRTTIETLSSVLGGVQSLHVSSYDEAMCIPDESSALLSLRTQQIIACESGIPESIDVFGGSYYLEKLTDEFEKKVWHILNKIEEMGGAVPALEKGYFHDEIGKSAWEEQKKIETGKKIVVGVNRFKSSGFEGIKSFSSKDEYEAGQIKKIDVVKSGRDSSAVESSLKRLRESSLLGENIMPSVLECVKAYATLAEIISALKEEFGGYRVPGQY